MDNQIIRAGDSEYVLTHVAEPRVNGVKCDQFEVRIKVEGQDAYHQFGDIYVPAGRSVQDHMEWWAGEYSVSFSEWSDGRVDGFAA